MCNKSSETKPIDTGSYFLAFSVPGARSRRKCFQKACFEHLGPLAQRLGPNSTQNLIPDTISTHIEGPKMLRIERVSQPLCISMTRLHKGSVSRNVSIRALSHISFELGYFLMYRLAGRRFLTYCLAYRHFLTYSLASRHFLSYYLNYCTFSRTVGIRKLLHVLLGLRALSHVRVGLNPFSCVLLC